MDSILTSIKKLLGITEEYEHFDAEIITHINTTLAILAQLGVGDGFAITDKSVTWNDFIGDDPRGNFVKSFVGLKVRLLFDPPQSSAVKEAMERTLSELEFRINVEFDGREE